MQLSANSGHTSLNFGLSYWYLLAGHNTIPKIWAFSFKNNENGKEITEFISSGFMTIDSKSSNYKS